MNLKKNKMATTIDLRYKSLLNYSPKQASSCVKLFVWILRKESVLFKQIAKHAEKNILKREQKKSDRYWFYLNLLDKTLLYI